MQKNTGQTPTAILTQTPTVSISTASTATNRHKLWSRFKYRASRHRYTAFVLLAVIALVLPHVVNSATVNDIEKATPTPETSTEPAPPSTLKPKDDPTQNYCKDAEKNAAWSKMFSEHPRDPVVSKLYAMRSGLCVMIQADLITLDDGINYFQEEWDRLLEQRERNNTAPPKRRYEL